MAPRSFRSVHVLLALFAGVLIGLIVHASGIFEDIFTPKGIRAIVVGPKPDQLNYPKLSMSKGAADIAVWVAKTKTDKVRIEFKDEIFKDMTPLANGRYLVLPGTTRVCVSGEIKPGVSYNEEGYKYWQILVDKDGSPHEADGHIIIKP